VRGHDGEQLARPFGGLGEWFEDDMFFSFLSLMFGGCDCLDLLGSICPDLSGFSPFAASFYDKDIVPRNPNRL
jgi:hypothetical protein